MVIQLPIMPTVKTFQKVPVKRAWKELRKNKRLAFIDLALLAIAALLIVQPRTTIYFHLVFALLIFGAFYWSLLAFLLRAGFWLIVVTVYTLVAIRYDPISPEELFELSVLVFVLFVVFSIARRRTGAMKALHASEERYRRLVELTSESIIIVADERFAFANSQAAELFKAKSRKDLVGKPVSNFLDPRGFESFQTLVRRTSTGNGEMPLLEDLLALSDGTLINIEVVGLVISYERQMAVQFIIRDITKRKQAVQEAIHTARMVALGNMATALAHELNNPLQIIQGYLDMVLDFPLPPDEKQGYLYIIRQQIENLRFLAHRTLNYAQSKHDGQQQVDLANLVEQIVIFTDKYLHQQGIYVIKEIQTVPPVLAVPQQLNQLFLNLIINAIQATGKGGDLHIAVKSVGEQVTVSFISFGSSIPPEEFPHLFKPFYTTKPDGSGLGLWISHKIVEWNGGVLAAENLEDCQGVIFTARFPAAVSEM